jgi:heme A synthase
VAEAVWTRDEGAEANDRARASVFVGVLALLSIPAGLALAAYSSTIDLIHVAVAVPVAGVLGIVAMALARNARRHSQISLGRIGGTGVARAGWILGLLALYFAVTAALAVGFFGLLLLFD